MNVIQILKNAALQKRSSDPVAKLASLMKDLLPGGKADNMPDSKFDKKKLQHAQKHEMEHTTNKGIAKEVAKDHLVEDSNYYKKIEKIEKKSSIRTRSGFETESNVVSPSAEDAAFLSSKPKDEKPALPTSKIRPQKSNSRLRQAVREATQKSVGIDPAIKQSSWAKVLEKLKEIGVN